jgi:Zn-dependent protease
VLLFEPDRTQFDLTWRMFGVHVRVHPMFWLVSAILGWPYLELGFQYLLVWVGCVFVSILIHELGHVFVGSLFGSHGHIVLYSFGGLAIGSSDLPNRWQRIAVFLGGPLAQFLLWGLIVLVVRNLATQGLRQVPDLAEMALLQLWWINLAWPVLNLLPIWPLDGGKISRELFDWLLPRGGIRVALGLSVLTAGLLAVNSLAATYGRPLIPYLYWPGLYSVLFFGLFAWSNFQELQQMAPRRRGPWDDDQPPPWQRDPDFWKR